MPTYYELKTKLIHIAPHHQKQDTGSYFVLMNSEELSNDELLGRHAKHAMKSLSKSNGSGLDIFQDFLVGAFWMLDRDDIMKQLPNVVFYLDANYLIIVDDTHFTKEAVDSVSQLESPTPISAAFSLGLFMKYLIKDDLAFLSKVESDLSDVESAILEKVDKVSNERMITMRRRLMKLKIYYEQLSDMANLLNDDEGDFISDNDQHMFRFFHDRQVGCTLDQVHLRNTACS